MTQDIEERGVKLRLTVVDTAGYGDSVNNTGGWMQAVDFVDEQFHSYLEQVGVGK